MKKHRTLLLTAFALTGLGLSLLAQDAPAPRPNDRGAGPRPYGGQAGPGDRGPGQPHPSKPPLIEALDANSDGVIDQQEIANASAALQKLDKDGDGKLTMEELRPPPREGEAGPGGPGGQGFRGPRGAHEGHPNGPRPQRPPADQ